MAISFLHQFSGGNMIFLFFIFFSLYYLDITFCDIGQFFFLQVVLFFLSHLGSPRMLAFTNVWSHLLQLCPITTAKYHNECIKKI